MYRMNDSKIIDLSNKIEAKLQAEKVYAVPQEKPRATISEADIWRACCAQQDGDAWLLTQIYRDRLCYDHAAGRWFEWAGHYWMPDHVENVIRKLDSVIDLYASPASDWGFKKIEAVKKGSMHDADKFEEKEKNYLKKIGQLQKKRWKDDVLKLAAAGEQSLGISGEKWDMDPWLLGCANGVLELKTGLFRPGKPSDYIKSACPTEWKGIDEPCPVWEKFLIEIFNGDIAIFDFVKRLLGYCLSGVTIDHIIPVFWGSRGRNGKGTFFNLLCYVLGPLAGPIQSELLLDQGKPLSSASARPDIMGLRGRRLVFSSETNDGRRMDLGRVKLLVGGDILCGREVFGKNEVSFFPTHKLFLQTNNRPKVDPNDNAIWERLKLIQFALSFVEEPSEPFHRKSDRFLPEKLKTEASGILAWMMAGCLEWQKIGLSTPDVVKMATQGYRAGEDLLGHFLADACFLGGDKKVVASDFYKAYQSWCEENGHKPISGTKFGEKMSERFQNEKTRTVKYYFGVGLLSDCF